MTCNSTNMERNERHNRHTEVAYDACEYFTDDFIYFNADLGKY